MEWTEIYFGGSNFEGHFDQILITNYAISWETVEAFHHGTYSLVEHGDLPQSVSYIPFTRKPIHLLILDSTNCHCQL